MPLEAQIALIPVAYAARQSSRQLHPGNLLRSGKPPRSCNHGWGESDSRFSGCCKCCRTGMDPKQEAPVQHIIHLWKDLRQPLKCSFPFSLATNRSLAFSIQMQTSWIQSECSSADWSDILWWCSLRPQLIVSHLEVFFLHSPMHSWDFRVPG